MKRVLGVLMAVFLLCGAVCTPALADEPNPNPNTYAVSYAWSAESVALGQTVTCTVSLWRVDGSDRIGGVSLLMAYDPDVLTYVSAAAPAGSGAQAAPGAAAGTLELVRTDSLTENGWDVGDEAAELITLTFTAAAAAESTALTLDAASEITNWGIGYEFAAAVSLRAAPTLAVTATAPFRLTVTRDGGQLSVRCTDSRADRTVRLIAMVYNGDGKKLDGQMASLLLTKDVEGAMSFTFTGQMTGSYKIIALDNDSYKPLCAAEGGDF